MYEENNDVKQRLIEIVRKEFLEQGYVKASMRNISAAADVTTGAIYFFFHNKEDFFRAILDETATDWRKHLQDYAESEINGSKSSAENDREL
ncbi:MAG: TetR/AcrR family transcriptional regulator, partial [Lachnospiraceae bacterium]|nr:TetR/AcrR family transcriptional regulator [Lachnospiraceae bacterium]